MGADAVVHLPVLAAMAPGFRTTLVAAAWIGGLVVVLVAVSIFGSGPWARRASMLNRYVWLSALALVVLFPIYVTIVNSLLRADLIAARPPTLFPTDPQWGTYADAWSEGHFGRYLFNTALVTTLTVVAQVVTSVFAAYAFAYLEFPLKRTLFVTFLATMMVPLEVTFLTNVQTVADVRSVPILGPLAGYDTYGALVVPFLATGFGAFLVRQSFMALPRDLRDAAALDGYGHWRFMLRVAVPLSRPTIAALSLFSFFGAWNQYLWPLLVTKDDRLRTVQIGLRQLSRVSIDRFNVTFAGTVLAVLPLLILLIVFQKQLVRGLTAGAVKG